MISPLQKDQQVADSIQNFNNPFALGIWWLGQSGFVIKYQNYSILFDPYLSETLSVKYAGTDKPHTRVSECVVQPELLPAMDMVTSSHNHTDHLDAPSLLPLFQTNPDIHFVLPAANKAFAADRLKKNLDGAIGLSEFEEFEFPLGKIIALPAAHNKLEKNEAGQNLFLSFIVKIGPYTLYHSGDTLWYEGLENLLAQHQVDVAFLPINGNKPERRVAGNLSAEEAAKLGAMAGIKCVIPHHYNLFEFNTENPTEFAKYCQQYNTPHKIMLLGECFVYAK
jgi:L-ascorbate metabolism protein UlaG (beta-lactamase superfamily)